MGHLAVSKSQEVFDDSRFFYASQNKIEQSGAVNTAIDSSTMFEDVFQVVAIPSENNRKQNPDTFLFGRPTTT
jgi:hypothetical protein